jgi:hypothetical protein
MTGMSKTLAAAALGASALAFSAASAQAAIVCSGSVCWHTTERYDYPADARVTIHEDTWKPAPDAKITFRERSGRGYWRDDKWVEW